jgi:hypothetical protein
MPITLPDITRVKPTTTPIRLPGIAKDSNTNPRPVRVSATGASGPKNPLVERADGAAKNKGFLGYQLTLGVDAAASADENGVGIVRGCYIDGFAGVVPQSNVWVDATAVPNPEAAFSGLTHTDPADGTLPVGVGVTTTKIYFFA